MHIINRQKLNYYFKILNKKRYYYINLDLRLIIFKILKKFISLYIKKLFLKLFKNRI